MLFTALSTSPSAQIRRAVLQREVAVWAKVKSGHICLFCLLHPPEHVLPCGHTMCDTCVCIFGSQARGAEYHFKLSACPACFETFSLTVRLLPPTKRPTILVLDGGGIRGVITLGFLKALEEQIGGSRGLREAFDLTVGTSAGKKEALWEAKIQAPTLAPLSSFPLLSVMILCGDNPAPH